MYSNIVVKEITPDPKLPPPFPDVDDFLVSTIGHVAVVQEVGHHGNDVRLRILNPQACGGTPAEQAIDWKRYGFTWRPFRGTITVA